MPASSWRGIRRANSTVPDWVSVRISVARHAAGQRRCGQRAKNRIGVVFHADFTSKSGVEQSNESQNQKRIPATRRVFLASSPAARAKSAVSPNLPIHSTPI